MNNFYVDYDKRLLKGEKDTEAFVIIYIRHGE